MNYHKKTSFYNTNTNTKTNNNNNDNSLVNYGGLQTGSSNTPMKINKYAPPHS